MQMGLDARCGCGDDRHPAGSFRRAHCRFFRGAVKTFSYGESSGVSLLLMET